jgi:hypothetical protein
MFITTIICWAAFASIIFTVDPETTNWVGFLLFYLSLFISLVGTFSIIGFLFRFTLLKRDLAFRSVKEAFRQSFLLSFLIIASMFLLAKNLFNWFNIAVMGVGLTVFELLLISYYKPRKSL